MVDALINYCARGAQMRQLCVDPIALHDVDRRECPRCALISGRALQDGPLNTPSRAFRCGIWHILEAAIDDRLKLINLGLGLLARIVPISLTTSAVRPARIAPIVRLSDTNAPVLAHPRCVRFFSAVFAVEPFAARSPMTAPVASWRLATLLNRSRLQDIVA